MHEPSDIGDDLCEAVRGFNLPEKVMHEPADIGDNLYKMV
jgi:hypothetical protein